MPPATVGASAAQTREHLVELLSPLVGAAGYDLEDITVTAAGRRSKVCVTVDRDGGIDLDAVAVISHVVSDALDADTSGLANRHALAQEYVLEVSSPGIDRPLTQPRHWRRAMNRLVTVQLGGRTVTGRVGTVDDDGVQFAVDGVERHASWTELGRGKVQIEFNRTEEE